MVDHLWVFGCAAHTHIPKDERQKLGLKARENILMGYGMEIAFTMQFEGIFFTVEMSSLMSLVNKEEEEWNSVFPTREIFSDDEEPPQQSEECSKLSTICEQPLQ